MPISRDGKLTIFLGVLALALTVTPGLQTWFAAAPLWALTVYAGWRWWQHRDTPPDSIGWLKLETRFKELQDLNLQQKDDGPLHAFQNEPGQESKWYVGGGGKNVTEDGKRLCGLAGRRLKTSGIADAYPRLRRDMDDLDRWLWFLVEIGQATRLDATDAIHGMRSETYPYQINVLTKASLAGCLECRLKHGVQITR